MRNYILNNIAFLVTGLMSVLCSIDIHASPPCGLTQYTVTGGGNLCNGAQTVSITLVPSSQLNIEYELRKNGAASGYASKFGTGAPLTWTITSGTGTYTVVAKTGSCTQTMTGSAVVTNQQTPVATITVSGTGCTTTLTGNGGTTYAWRESNPTGPVIATTAALQPKKNGLYYVTATNTCGNSHQISYNLTTIPGILIVPSASPANTCPNTIQLSATGGSNYLWTIPTLPNATTSTASAISVPVAGSYTLAGKNGCNLDVTTTQVVTFAPKKPTPVMEIASIKIAHNTSITLKASGSQGINWYNASGILVNNGEPQYITPNLTESTVFYAAIPASDDKCESERAATNITVNKLPVVTIDPVTDILLPNNQTFITSHVTNPDGDVQTLEWKQVAGPRAVFKGTANGPLIVSDLGGGLNTFSLTVNDGYNAVTATVSFQGVYPPNNFSYIKETSVLTKDKLTEADVSSLSITGKEKNVSFQYFDGAARAMQQISVQGSPAGKDLVTPVYYDPAGRESRKYLPVVMDEINGNYKVNSTIIDPVTGNYIGAASNVYAIGSDHKIADDVRPFSEIIFEPSPLNRPDKIYGAGSAWQPSPLGQNKFSQELALTNTAGTSSNMPEEKILPLKISGTTVAVDLSVNSGAGYYRSGTLTIKCTKDEEGAQVREYVNKLGQLILKKVQVVATPTGLNDVNQWASTYYVYDDFGNLAFVLQPELSKKIINTGASPTATELADLAFQYKYDSRKRMISKQTPGSGAVYMVYDLRNRLVLTQNATQRPNKQWSYTKYDVLNRPIITGIYTHTAVIDQATMTSKLSTTIFGETYNGVAATHGYTSTVFPTATFPATNFQILTVTYYDNYKFRTDLVPSAASYTYKNDEITGQEAVEHVSLKGLVTGTKVNQLGSTNYLWSVNYYDQRSRVIQIKSLNHKGGIDITTNLYDFVRLKESRHVHNFGTEKTTHRKFDYDHQGRLLRIWHRVNTEQFVILHENIYNELGEIVAKKMHSRDNGLNYLQSIDYRYNIRGWLEKINDPSDQETSDLFSMDLKYDKPGANGGSPRFNGDISESIWKAAGSDKQSYGYKYDGMGRLLEANYYNPIRPLNNGRYTEKITNGSDSYDLNGNIKGIERYGKTGEQLVDGFFRSIYGKIDHMQYAVYKGNQLVQVKDNASDGNFDDTFKDGTSDAAVEYSYDANGNMITDANRGITAITYNFLNLPVQVNKGATDYIVYTYDALGNKLTQQVFGTNAKTTEYLGEFVYEKTTGTDVLQFITHEEGRIVPDVTAGALRPWSYQYFLKDHLGNARVVVNEKTSSVSYTATMEETPTEIELEEEANFLNLIHNKKVMLYNHTAGIGKVNSYRLSGSPGEVVGPAKSFDVNPGDAFDLEVYVRYEAPSANSSAISTFTNALIGAFGLQPSGGPGREGQQAYDAFSSVFSAGSLTSPDPGDPDAPRAYLNYILFDENFATVDLGYDQVSTVAATTHDYLNLNITVKKKGYLYIWLSNENDKIIPLFFDDFKIRHHSNLEQVNSYYPFGLPQASNGFQRTNSAKNSVTFQGQELQDEMNLGWVDYKARMYQPELGRFFSTDGMVDCNYPSSPYAFALSNPVGFKDPDGNFTIGVHSNLTYRALCKYGYGYNTVKLLKHYASVYADNPARWIRIASFMYKKSDIDYSETAHSQDTDSPTESARHAMEGDHEDIGYYAAVTRGQEFGWRKLFEAAKEGSIDSYKINSRGAKAFGVGMHALQDSKVHNGVKFKFHDHLADLGNNRAEDYAKQITESAIIVMEALNGDFSHLKDGMDLDISGMGYDQYFDLVNTLLKSDLKDIKLWHYSRRDHEEIETGYAYNLDNYRKK